MTRNRNKEMRICIVCGEPFEAWASRNRQICSDGCSYKLESISNKGGMKECAYCGHEFPASHKGLKCCSEECMHAYKLIKARERDRKYAKLKAERNIIKSKVCLYCGENFIPKGNHYYQKFCSNEHQTKFSDRLRVEKNKANREKKPCAVCGMMFISTREHKKYCPDCKKIASQLEKERQREYARANRKPRPSKIKYCQLCGKQLPNGKRKYCCDDHLLLATVGHPQAQEIVRVCEWCGKEYSTRISRSRACKKHARKLLKWERKMRMRNILHLPYVRGDIFERDNFKCHICGNPINMDAKVPDPYSPTIDHVIPLAKGGNDAPNNVRAAHFICNVLKSDNEILQ